MICPNCGKELVDHAKFCAGCGQRIIREEQPVVEEATVVGVPEPVFAEEAPVAEAPAFAEEATVVGMPPVFTEEATVVGAPEAVYADEATVIGMAEPTFADEATVIGAPEEGIPSFEETAGEESVKQMPRFMADGLQTEEDLASMSTFAVEPPDEKRKKKSKIGLIIGLCAAGLAVAAAVVLLILFGPKWFGKEKASEKKTNEGKQPTGIVAEYPEREKLFDIGLDDDAKKLQRYSMDVDASFVGGYMIPEELHGLSFRYTQDMSKPDRLAGFWLEATRDDQTMEAKMLVDDSELYLSQEDLLGQGMYGVNTETVGADLDRLLGSVEELPIELPEELAGLAAYTGLGFNTFDLMSEAYDASNAAGKKPLLECLLDLVGAVETDKVGDEILEVHGVDYACVKRSGVLPREDAEEILGTAADSVMGIDYEAFVSTFIGGIGLPEETETNLIEKIGVQNPEMFAVNAWLSMFMNDVGDVELDLYYSGDYLMAIGYEKDIDGTAVKATLYISGEEYYGDELTMIVEVDGYKVEIHSVGNHAGVDDVLNDKTTVTIFLGPVKVGTVTSEMTFAYKDTEDNFSWKVESKELGIYGEISGNITLGGGAIELDLKNVKVELGGEVAVEGSLRVRYANYNQRISGTKKLVTEMSPADLLRFLTKIGTGRSAFDEKYQAVVHGN